MIVTVTLNPSIDRTIAVDSLVRGGVNRAELIQVDAGGKGVNVSRALAKYGAETHAIFVGAQLGAQFLQTLFRVKLPRQAGSKNAVALACPSTTGVLGQPGIDGF